jgi:HTH-type transcriptional regulator, competence development regulator
MLKDAKKLGAYLKAGREAKGLTLRAVEDTTGISNAYLSQVEGGKIKRPSPVDLGKLCELYGLEYTLAMEYAGYPLPEGIHASTQQHRFLARLGSMTDADEDALVDYMDYLRLKKRKKK